MDIFFYELSNFPGIVQSHAIWCQLCTTTPLKHIRRTLSSTYFKSSKIILQTSKFLSQIIIIRSTHIDQQITTLCFHKIERQVLLIYSFSNHFCLCFINKPKPYYLANNAKMGSVWQNMAQEINTYCDSHDNNIWPGKNCAGLPTHYICTFTKNPVNSLSQILLCPWGKPLNFLKIQHP